MNRTDLVRRPALVLLFGALASLAFAGCPEEKPAQVCTPGRSEACVGEGGCSGGQRCNEDGTAFGECVCGAPGSDAGTDAGTSDAGADAGASDAGTDAGTSDAGTSDAGEDDAGVPPCNPVAEPGSQGCAFGQKCAWVILADAPQTLGFAGCVPDGVAQLGEACTQGEAGATTGFDDCVAGAVCISGTCRDICGFDSELDPSGCGPLGACVRYAGLFGNGEDDPVAGACVTSCNPVTQELADGGTCGAGNGCYIMTSLENTIGICAQAGTVEHNQVIVGTSFVNSCVPRHAPRPRFGSNDIECGALCLPAEVTSTTNTDKESGIPPYTCETVSASSPTPAASPGDATAGESCRFWWARENFEEKSQLGNTVGWCFKHAAFQYDSNGDQIPDAPVPRCVTLTTGDVVPPISNPTGNDALEFYCLPSTPAGNPLLPRSFTPAPIPQLKVDRLGGWRD